MAGWYDSNYKYRAPMTLLAQGTGVVDFEIDLPSTWAQFWDTIQSTAFDIRVTMPDGITPVTYDRDNFSYANKTLQIEIDNYSTGITAQPQFVWLYYGYAAATDGIAAFVPAAPLVGKLPQEQPPAAYIVKCAPQSAGSTKPRDTIVKGSNETIFVYWDVSDLLARSQGGNNGSQFYEGVPSIISSKVMIAGVDQAAMHTAVSATPTNPFRLIESGGRIFIRTDCTGGTSGVDYTLEVSFYGILGAVSLADNRILACRALLKVQDVSEV